MPNLLEIGEMSLWRLYVGLAVTGIGCWLAISFASDLTTQLVMGIPIVVAGVLLAFYWQTRAYPNH